MILDRRTRRNDPVEIELDAEARSWWDRYGTVGIDSEGLREHRVSGLDHEARRIVWELEVRAVGRAEHVQVCDQPDAALGPRVRYEVQPRELRHVCDLN